MNEMARHLTHQVRLISRTLTALAMGHFAYLQPPHADGEMAALLQTVDALRDNLVALQERLPAGTVTAGLPAWSGPGQPIREKGNPFWIAWILDDLGTAARERGDYQAAPIAHTAPHGCEPRWQVTGHGH